MSGYPYHPPPGYSYGGPPPPHPCGSSGPPLPQQYGSSASQEQQQYGSSAPPQSQQYGSAPSYGSPPYGSSYGAPAGSNKPPKENPYAASAPGGGIGYPPSAPYGSSFTSLLPSTFPPGADPSIVACFQIADQDGSGFIDDKELQRALSSYNQSFSLRTVHLLMHHFTNTSTRTIGPKDFTQVFYSLQSWRGIFERFDRDRSGKIDANELREALLSLGFAVSPVILDLLVSKFDKTGGKNNAIEYDNFIEYVSSLLLHVLALNFLLPVPIEYMNLTHCVLLDPVCLGWM
ncbi:Calcium-binding protein CBP [Linum perenne]